jgi:hypothetical protein
MGRISLLLDDDDDDDEAAGHVVPAAVMRAACHVRGQPFTKVLVRKYLSPRRRQRGGPQGKLA